MKLLIALVLASWLAELVAVPGQASVREDNVLRPEELGIRKFVFEARLTPDKVMVLRSIIERGGSRQVMDTIVFRGSEPAQEAVLLYDASSFPFGEPGSRPRIVLRSSAFNTEFTNCRIVSMVRMPRRVVVTVRSDDRSQEATLTFVCSVQDYKALKARIPDLPATGRLVGWTYNHLVEPQLPQEPGNKVRVVPVKDK
ncbi:hypothetical protein HRbin36_00168 [bacterium HR36]|nr:hypothetical protein HRbin36_00168 [bacterium HR36]